EWKKNVYVDGHERENIVRYQQKVFLPMMAELESLLIEYDENDLTLVKKNNPLNQKPHCIITHDETTLAANDNKKTGWRPGEQHLAYSKIPNRYVTETLEVGVNHDGYWNAQLLAEQLKRTIDVLKIALLGTIFEFAFNNSSSHGAFAEDALVASRMNIKYGGKQPRMCPGQLPDGTSQLDYKNCLEDEEKICCNMRKLARQPDFMEQKNVLEDIVYSR
ncbi:4313_t:CDS:2, partial [Racocetra persica]